MKEINEYRIFGAPGTGKTTRLSEYIEKACKTRGSSDVLVASFTKAAAEELVSRNLPIDRDCLGTLHSLCYRALGSPEIAEPHIQEFNKEFPMFAVQGGGKLDLDDPYASSETPGNSLFGQYQILRAKMTDYDEWPNTVKLFGKIWDSWKHDNNLIDFTDMIDMALQDGVRPSQKIGFFDECQDFVPSELALIRYWAEKMEQIIICGDDDQCIYGFKGASPDSFLFPEIPNENKRILPRGWRLPGCVHEKSTQWIRQIKHRQEKEVSPRLTDDGNPASGEFRFLSDGSYKFIDPIMQDCEQYIKAGKSIMFLTSCSYMLDSLIKMLKSQGIPFANRYRRKRGDWNPLKRGKNFVGSVDRVYSFMLPRLENRTPTPDEFQQWASILKAEGNIKHGMKKQINTRFDGKEVIDMDFLNKFFEEPCIREILSANLDWFEQNIVPSKNHGIKYPVQIARKNPELLIKEPKITVGTIHSVKGGQADIVYLFPDLSMQGMNEYALATGRDNIIRQFYVGMTRAFDGLILCPPASAFHCDFNVLR